MSSTIALLFTDPGCPWGYSARPAFARLRWRFGDQIEWRPVMIGLSETDPDRADAALLALQLMQFTTAGLLDEDDDLRAALARVPGLDADAIVSRIDDPAVVAAYEADRALARTADGSPTLVAAPLGLVVFLALSLMHERPLGMKSGIELTRERELEPVGGAA